MRVVLVVLGALLACAAPPDELTGTVVVSDRFVEHVPPGASIRVVVRERLRPGVPGPIVAETTVAFAGAATPFRLAVPGATRSGRYEALAAIQADEPESVWGTPYPAPVFLDGVADIVIALQPASPPPPPSPRSAGYESFVVSCPATQYGAELMGDDLLALTLPDGAREAFLQEGDGRYTGDTGRVRLDADRVTLTRTGQPEETCARLDDPAELAQRKGVWLFASGAEPGWALTVSGEQVHVAWEGGARDITLPSPLSDRHAEIESFTAEGEGHRLVVEVRADEFCIDPLTSHTSFDSVTLTVDGESLAGCVW